MFVFNYEGGASAISVWLVWILVFALLFALNEVTRRSKEAGFLCFIIMPIILSILWFTVLSDTTYTDWFHLAKVYSSTAGCIGFWCIRHLHGENKNTGKEWRLSDSRFALCFPPLILAINICEAVVRDIEVGLNYAQGGFLADEAMYVLGGPWNFMTISGWVGIYVSKDKSKDMIWPDQLWFWIIAYDLWNFAYVYNCIADHSFYAGAILLLSCTIPAFFIKKGAWLQHRAHTLALWCMFAQTFPSFIDSGKFAVSSTYNTTALTIWSFAALLVNIIVLVFMIYKTIKTKRNPYKGELYIDMSRYQEVKSFAE